ncbi:redoxin domain-containing protein [Rubritalea profundi]|nr:redoxin domain-containing protein [Rubritalea profundi]
MFFPLRSITSSSALLLTLALAPVCSAAEPRLEGHSHQGHAFNEGPRQSAPLVNNTGQVHFPITTSWKDGQDYFNQGLGQLHGFWYYEAERSFRQIVAKDPTCAMAYWGLAMANWENEKRAKEFIAKANQHLDKASDHEKLYIKAQANYLDGKPDDAKKRNQKLLHDIESIIDKHPDDIEAKAMLCVRLWQFSRKGLPITSHEAVDALLQQILAVAPHHPAHHYRIHLWDKRNAKRALDSAAKLGSTAPAIAHMWHMPGHIYSKLHRYEDAAWHQQASARIDHGHMIKQLILPDQIHNYAHNNEWLSRNWVHLGNASSALSMAKSLLANPRHPTLNTLEGKAHSYNYGRRRLAEILEKFELWETAIELTSSHWFEPVDVPKHEYPRLRLIGLAHFQLGQKPELEKTITQFDSLIETARTLQKSAQDKASEKAKTDKKSDKETETLVKAAGKSAEGTIKQIKKYQTELNGLVAELNGDKEESLKALKQSARPKWAKALRYLHHGDLETANKLSEEAVTKSTHQTLPLAARIEILHAQGKTEETRSSFEQLRKISSQIDLTTPPFVRLAPIAKSLGLPDNWTQPDTPATDTAVRPELDSLGPIHWTPAVAPGFSHADQNNKPISLADYQGKPLLLIFYLGHGCLHCSEQLNALADRSMDFKDISLPILAISTDTLVGLKKSQENFSAEGENFPFPLIADPEKASFHKYSAHDDFENEPLHGTFLISGTGRILWSDISADPFMDIDFLLSEAKRLPPLHK